VRRIPLLLVGDGPQEATGLGRIARDLAGQILSSDLPLDLVQVGGPIPPVWTAWRHVPMDEGARGEDWGAAYVEATYRSIWGDEPGIVWLIWDPSRLVSYMTLQLPVQRWAYTAIDAGNRLDRISGPAADALQVFDRVLAYGRWASGLLRSVRTPVPYLPHGLTLAAYETPASEAEAAWVRQQIGPHRSQQARLVGCVAANQPRKDFALYFETLAELRARGHQVYGWLHTDVLVKAWSVQQLVEDCGLAKRVTVTLDTYTDRQLALLYQACDVTIAPGLGEGFGYPLVESLAAGVPVVHGDFGGGVELVPKVEWRFPVRERRLESVYALQRPVFRAADVANAIERIWQWREAVGEATGRAYCRGAVAHLEWQALWPRWYAWIKQGLEG
jgi:glycosyltransferase involved in cell wall biosynthesis